MMRSAAILLLLLLTGCYQPAPGDPTALPSPTAPPLARPDDEGVLIAGSRVMGPLVEGMAGAFDAWQGGGIPVMFEPAGTRRGFELFCAGAADIAATTEPIPEGDALACASVGIEWLALPIAYQVTALITHPANNWLNCLTMDELSAVWGADRANVWSDVRAGWPDLPITLYAPPDDNPTAIFFRGAVLGTDRAKSAPPLGSPGELAELPAALALISGATAPADARFVGVGESCLKPGDDAYPLARPLYVYTSPDALARYEVATFLSYAFSADGRALIVDADFIPPPDAEFRAAREALAEAAP